MSDDLFGKMRTVIIANVFEHSSSENDFHSQLGNYGLRIFLDRTRDGNSIFGTTVVDIINHQAFKGSDLDKMLNKDIKDAFAVKGAERIYNPIFQSFQSGADDCR